MFPIIANDAQLQHLRKHVKNSKSILILGLPGCGKTTMISLLCQEQNMNVLEVHKENFSQIEPFVFHNTIESFFDKRKKAVLFDNIEVLLTNDKVQLSYVINLIKSGKVIVIVICNSMEEKKVTELKKHVELVRMQLPTPEETYNLLISYFPSLEKEAVLKVAMKYKGNVRETYNQLTIGANNDISNYRNLTPYECVAKMLTSDSVNHDDIMFLVDFEPSIISCTYLENLPEEIHKYRYPKDIHESMSTYNKVLARYVDSTKIENCSAYFHELILWDIVYLVRFLTANELPNRKTNASNCSTTNDIKPSQALSKISHKQIMNKRMRTWGRDLSLEIKILLTDRISKVHPSEKDRKKMFSGDECNYINTYVKYFA